MPTKLPFLFLLLFGSFFSCAPKKSIYYKHISDAYINISNGDYKASVKSFKKARRKIDYFLANDHYNAFQASLKVNDMKFASYNALQLAELGMCYSFFKQYPQITNDRKLNEALIRVCKQEKKFNTYYIDTLYKMRDEDQLIHGNPDTYHLRRPTDSLNLQEFQSLIDLYGFPVERKIGIECTSALKGFQAPVYSILFIHFAGNGFDHIDTFLENWLDSMYISPSDFLLYRSFHPNKRISGGEIVYNEGEYYVECPKSGGIEEINKIRKKYGLWPIEVQLKLIKDKKAGKNIEFRVATGVTTGMPQDIIEQFFIKIGEDDDINPK